MIPTRTLGDLRVSALGLGCMGMSHAYGTADPDEARATLEAALAAGVTLYDTADMYGNGANEEFLAPFVQAHRDEIVLATKFGFINDENAKPVGLDGRPALCQLLGGGPRPDEDAVAEPAEDASADVDTARTALAQARSGGEAQRALVLASETISVADTHVRLVADTCWQANMSASG